MTICDYIHVFASHKGGTGKTQLCFQAATQYAKENPEINVLLLDMTELGDLTKRCLGGKDESVTEKYFGKVFDLIQTTKQAIKEEEQGVVGKFVSLFRSKAEINIESASMLPFEENAGVPQNVHLVSSGAATFEDDRREPEETLKIAESLRKALQESDVMWKVFIDTDGDRRPAPFTKLAYALGDLCIVPIQPDESDFARLKPMFEMMHEMYLDGEMQCQIQMLVWNKIQVYKKEKSEVGHFTPTKVVIDTISYLNKQLFEMAKSYGQLFFHKSCTDKDEFARKATLLVRDFPNTVCYPANSQGIPFCQMKPGKVTLPGDVVFQVKQDQITCCEENISVFLKKLNEDDGEDLPDASGMNANNNDNNAFVDAQEPEPESKSPAKSKKRGAEVGA